MLVTMNVIEWNAQGQQVRSATHSIRAHKPPCLPEERYQVMRDGVWQERREGKACLTLATWRTTCGS